MILSVVVAGIVAFGVGYALGASDVANWVIDKAISVGIINDINKAELWEYYLKMKGGV